MSGDKLTPRQREVVAYLRDHPLQPRSEAADALDITPGTLSNLLTQVYERMGIKGGRGVNKFRRLIQEIDAQPGKRSESDN